MTTIPRGRRSATTSVHVTFGDTYNGPITRSSVGGSSNVNNLRSGSTSSAKGFDLLTANVADQAFHDSGEAADPSTCHPGTRVDVLAKVEEWTKLLSRDQLIIWVKGSAGVGKTVIARTIAQMLAERNQLLASFFFWRSGQRCNNAQYFVATISYQICQQLPACKPRVAQIIKGDPKIFTRTMRVQVEKLVTNPISSIWCDKKRDRGHDTIGAFVIVIDGLDECLQAGVQPQSVYSHPQDESKQSEILVEMHRAMMQLRQQKVPFHLKLLISSRPERHIHGVFDTELKRSTFPVMLNESYDSTDDIRRYYIDKFRALQDLHPLRHHLPTSGWPSTDELDSLVDRASGQFIYASTVVQFVGSKNKIPSNQLKVILERRGRSGAEHPLEKLDLLYKTIFQQIDQNDLPATRLLMGILLSNQDKFMTRYRRPTFWDLFLGWPSGEVERLLMVLDPVLLTRLTESDPDSCQFFHFYHASLQMFLLDEGRSGPFAIDLDSMHEKMAVLCIQHLSTHDDNIAWYLRLTMEDWLQAVNLVPIARLMETLIKGDAVYPPNLKSPYPAFLNAVSERIRQEDSMDPKFILLCKEKHDLYLRLLQGVVMQYLDLEEDVTAYLVIIAAQAKYDTVDFFLSEDFVGYVPDQVTQIDRAGLDVLNYVPRSEALHAFFADALSLILDEMPNKGVCFARGAAFFISRVHCYDWSQYYDLNCMESRRDCMEAEADILRHLLQCAAPLTSLQDCIHKYPICEPYQNDAKQGFYVVQMQNAVADYVARVEKEDTCLPSENLDTLSEGWLMDTEVSSTEPESIPVVETGSTDLPSTASKAKSKGKRPRAESCFEARKK